jgi:hypothetical protein
MGPGDAMGASRPAAAPEVRDLVIEVEWSRVTGLAKHEIYRRLGVRELWTLKSDDRLVLRVRQKNAWIERSRSRLLPTLDLPWLLSFLAVEPQSRALLALRDALRAPRRRR